MARKSRVAVTALALALSLNPIAAAAETADFTGPEPFFSYRLPKEPQPPEHRGLIGREIATVLLPGLDQWRVGESRSAAVYSGYAALGVGAVASATNGSQPSSDLSNVQDDQARRIAWGNQSYMDAGFVSAFHAFRAAAETWKPDGRFLFLTHEETTGDLLIAPLRFDYLGDPAVLIPVGVLAGLLVAGVKQDRPHYNFNGGDTLYGTAISYNAGVGEEAFFRGYMMPMFYDWWDNKFWSNVATSTLFAAAHISSSNPVPWPQFLLGLYLGWNSQRNDWTLSKGVFIHAWWDTLLFASQLAYNRGSAAYLPLVQAEF